VRRYDDNVRSAAGCDGANKLDSDEAAVCNTVT